MPFARAFPPMRPSATAAAFLPSSVVISSISPVAILAIMIALPMASAGRFSPLGPRGIVSFLVRGGVDEIRVKPNHSNRKNKPGTHQHPPLNVVGVEHQKHDCRDACRDQAKRQHQAD